MNKYKTLAKQSREDKGLERCREKLAFDTKESAEQNCMTVYLCRHCSKYHRSSQFARLVARVSAKRKK